MSAIADEKKLDKTAQQTLFTEARSHNGWQDRQVDDALLKQIYELMKFGPTSANCCPARIVFVKSDAAKQKLKDCLMEGNVEKSMTAPVIAIIAMDMEFYEYLPRLFPHTDAKSWYAGKPEKIYETAFRNSSLQGAYFMLAARTLGLDCGPMSGFNAEKLASSFFPSGQDAGQMKANFICALGYGDPDKLHPRGPRLDFEEVCDIV